MTSTSYFACASCAGAAPPGKRRAMPRQDLVLEPARLGLALRHREARHEVALLEGDLAALGDEQRVVAGVRVIAEDPPHLGGGLEVVLLAVELEAVRVVHGRAGADAQQHLLGLRIGLVHVVQVVGGDQRHAELLGELEQVAHRAPLDLDAVVGDLGEEVLLAEDVLELRRGLARLVVLTEAQAGLHLAADAARGRDDALRVPSRAARGPCAAGSSSPRWTPATTAGRGCASPRCRLASIVMCV